MSSLVRIRLSFQRSLPFAEAKNCWFLFDASTCSTIADLEYLIQGRFGERSRSSSINVINLYLDDYLLPSQEKIDIIQQNDNIRVVLEQFIVTTSSSEEDESCQDAEKKVKRKKKSRISPDARDKSKRKSKKKSPLLSTSCVSTHDKSNEAPKGNTSKVLKKKHKTSNPPQTQPAKSNVGKRKNADNVEPSTSNAKKSETIANGIGKNFRAGKDAVGHESYSSQSSSSAESSSESFYKLTSTSCVSTHNKSNEAPKGNTSKVLKKKHKTRNPPQTQPAKSNFGKRKNVDNSEPSIINAKKSKTSENGMGKDICAGKDAVHHESYSSESSSSTESCSESSDESGPSKLHSNDSNVNGIKSTDLKAAKGRCNHGKSPLHGILGKDVKYKASTFALQKENKGKAAHGIVSKSSTTSRGKKKENCAGKPSSSSSSLSTSTLCSEESKSILKKAAKKKDMSYLSSSELSISITSPRSSSEKEYVKNGKNDKKKTVDVIRNDTKTKQVSSSLSSSSLLSSLSTPSNEKDSNIQEMYKNTETLLYALSSSSLPLPSSSSLSTSSDNKHGDTTVTCLNQSMTSNLSEKAKRTGQMNTLERTSRTQHGKSGAGHIRFDSEDETVEEQEEVRSLNNITDDADSTIPYSNLKANYQNDQKSSKKSPEQKQPAQRDFSRCTPLHGPPRSRDKIAYKVLELSASYTPEVSDYKEGTVLSYESNSGAVTIELTKESLKKARASGDGNVSRKFELDYDDDQENDENVGNEETDPEVVVLWSTMLDPVLISD